MRTGRIRRHISKGRTVFGRSKQIETKLLEEAWSGHDEKVGEILYKHPDLVNASVSKSMSRRHDKFTEGDTALHLAVQAEHLKTVERLLSHRASVNVTSSDGATPLHYAAMMGSQKIADLLLNQGASVEAYDDSGWGALHHAAQGGRIEMAQFLVAHGAIADTKDRQGNTPLHLAAQIGSEPLVKLMAANGADVNDRNEQGRSPLHVVVISADHTAASHGSSDRVASREATVRTVRQLLNLGTDVNAEDAAGETAMDKLLYLEGEQEDDSLVSLLRAHGGQCLRYRHRTSHGSSASGTEPPSNQSSAGIGYETLTDSPIRRPVSRVSSDRSGARIAPIQLGKTPLVIGRNPDCDVRLASRTLSRHHARIELRDNGYIITDLGSSNGTLVDGEQITRPYLLEPDDMITLGVYEFEFDGQQLIPTQGELAPEQLDREQRML